MRAAARLPIMIRQTGDGFLIQRWVHYLAGRLAFSLITPAFLALALSLRLHNVSFGIISHFTIFKSNTAML
jgi:hypothetical protein